MQGQEPARAEFGHFSLASDKTIQEALKGQPCVCPLGVWEGTCDGVHLTEVSGSDQTSRISVSGGAPE